MTGIDNFLASISKNKSKSIAVLYNLALSYPTQLKDLKLLNRIFPIISVKKKIKTMADNARETGKKSSVIFERSMCLSKSSMLTSQVLLPRKADLIPKDVITQVINIQALFEDTRRTKLSINWFKKPLTASSSQGVNAESPLATQAVAKIELNRFNKIRDLRGFPRIQRCGPPFPTFFF
jgi:hypothetical protein